jgi:hypothetical protein
MESKLELIQRVGREIEAAKRETALAKTAEELLNTLCDDWGYPRYNEIGRYQLSFGGSGNGSVTYFLRDKETGVVVHTGGRNDEGARANCLRQIRIATLPEHVDVCFPKRDSLHASLCTCPKASSPGVMQWDDENDFERVLGYGNDD